MRDLAFIILFAAGTAFFALRFFRARLELVKLQVAAEELRCLDMRKETERIVQESRRMEKVLEETMALYDITKDICQPLEEEKVVLVMRDEMRKFFHVEECEFIPEHEAFLPGEGDSVLALRIDRSTVGHLVCHGIREEDKEKFHIIAHQCVLGLRRAHLYSKLQAMAITDGLTQVASRRFCLERLGEELERSKKFSYAFSVLMLDVDMFKGCNDTFGHLVGDAVLREVAKSIKENLRLIDLVGRYGGEEFLIILAETDKEGAKFAAERIRQAVESKKVHAYDEDLHVTVSIGVASFPADAGTPQALIEKSDAALYLAKQSGRNRVVTA